MSDPEVLIRFNAKPIRDLHNVVGDSDICEHLNRIIRNLAGYVHLLPASDNWHHFEMGGLFLHSLETARYAGRLFSDSPQMTNPSEAFRNHASKRWMFCAILAGMLHDLGKPGIDYHVKLFGAAVFWSPASRSLEDWARQNSVDRYELEWAADRNGFTHAASASSRVHMIVPRETREWITAPYVSRPSREVSLSDMSGAAAWDALEACLRGDKESPLYAYMSKADSISVRCDILRRGALRRGWRVQDVDSTIQYIRRTLERLIQSTELTLNDLEAPHVVRTRHGAVLSTRALKVLRVACEGCPDTLPPDHMLPSFLEGLGLIEAIKGEREITAHVQSVSGESASFTGVLLAKPVQVERYEAAATVMSFLDFNGKEALGVPLNARTPPEPAGMSDDPESPVSPEPKSDVTPTLDSQIEDLASSEAGEFLQALTDYLCAQAPVKRARLSHRDDSGIWHLDHPELIDAAGTGMDADTLARLFDDAGWLRSPAKAVTRKLTIDGNKRVVLQLQEAPSKLMDSWMAGTDAPSPEAAAGPKCIDKPQGPLGPTIEAKPAAGSHPDQPDLDDEPADDEIPPWDDPSEAEESDAVDVRAILSAPTVENPPSAPAQRLPNASARDTWIHGVNPPSGSSEESVPAANKPAPPSRKKKRKGKKSPASTEAIAVSPPPASNERLKKKASTKKKGVQQLAKQGAPEQNARKATKNHSWLMDNQQELDLPDREHPPPPAEPQKPIPKLSHHEEQIVRRSLGSVRMLGAENVEAALREFWTTDEADRFWEYVVAREWVTFDRDINSYCLGDSP